MHFFINYIKFKNVLSNLPILVFIIVDIIFFFFFINLINRKAINLLFKKRMLIINKKYVWYNTKN